MTPDIREKAEDMVRGFLLLNKQDYLLGTYWHRDLAENLSQALLEAHKAGREEERERCAEIAEHYEVYLAAADMRNPEVRVAKLAAIRSLP